MRKAERLFQIITILRSRRRVITASMLAELLEVSERTVYRDLQALIMSGVPIEGEAGVGYRLQSGYSLPPMMFTQAELQALMLGVHMVKAWTGDTMVQAASAALDKIYAILPDAQHYRQVQMPSWLMVPDFFRQQMASFIDDLNPAIEERQELDLQYQRENGEISKRRVQPLGLIYWGKSWTLVAWCLLRDAYRVFRLDRIRELIPSGVYFDTDPERNLQHYMSLETKRQKAVYSES